MDEMYKIIEEDSNVLTSNEELKKDIRDLYCGISKDSDLKYNLLMHKLGDLYIMLKATIILVFICLIGIISIVYFPA